MSAAYSDLPNVASPLLGAAIVFATDEWFAAAENVIKDEDPVWLPTEFTTFGKWMDGWECRRRRTEGHDWCIIKLGMSTVIKAIEVDTAFFTGNFSPKVSVYGTYIRDEPYCVEQLMNLRQQSIDDRPEYKRMGLCATEEEWELVSQLKSNEWPCLVPLTPLGAGYEDTRKTVFEVSSSTPVTHIRVNMGPDGGIARIRVHGEVVLNLDRIPRDVDIDLAAVEVGGLAIACSNKHYGHPRNMIVPGRGNCMGDGWETARQPNRPAVYEKGPDGLMLLPGFDWAILQLGLKGSVSELEIDTHFFKGNYPESCLVEACNLPKDKTFEQIGGGSDYDDDSVQWRVLLPRTRLTSDAKHIFSVSDRQISNIGTISHIRVTIYPDGGIMRVRVRGRPSTINNSVERSRL